MRKWKDLFLGALALIAYLIATPIFKRLDDYDGDDYGG
jgi:hypothetical protein